jgi:hypothetical protein
MKNKNNKKSLLPRHKKRKIQPSFIEINEEFVLDYQKEHFTVTG